MKSRKLQLLENGLCFILQSINHFEQSEKEEFNSEKELKYSTLHLFSGIFLILKEKLRQEHWSLLFSNVNEANEQSLKSGDFQGVNFKSCQNRLLKIASINFTKTEDDILNSLRKKRNKIEHFFEKESLISFKSTLAHGLYFTLIFINKYLDSNLSNNEKRNIEEIKEKCFGLREFVKQRMQVIKPELDKQEVVLYCYECGNTAIVPNEDEMRMECLFCNRVVSENEYEDFYYDSQGVTRTKDFLSINNMLCLECENENYFVKTKDKKEYFCLHCHYKAEVESFSECGYCGTLYEDDLGGFPACHFCSKNIFSGPD